MLRSMWNIRNTYSLLVRIQNATVIWTDRLIVFYKAELNISLP